MRKISLHVVAVVTGALATATVAGTAQAAPQAAAPAATRVACGATVTTNAYLAADLTCATGDGVTLAAGVTLDLRGHRLTGGGAYAGGGTVGVQLSTGGSAVVKNGTIQNWYTGIESAYTGPGSDQGRSGVVLRGVVLRSNGTGLDAVQATADIRGSAFVANRFGVLGNDSSSITVRGTTVRGNEEGITVSETLLDVAGSVLSGNKMGVDCNDSWCQLVGDRFVGNAAAVTFGTSLVTETTGIEVRGNAFTGNGVGVTDSSNVLPSSVLVKGNTFTKNRDGVYVLQRGVRIGGNSAVHNRRWGIYAPGAVDLGGNKASGNGRPAQCVGVAC